MSRIDDLRAAERTLLISISTLEARRATPGVTASELRQIEREVPVLRQRLATIQAEITAAGARPLPGPSDADRAQIGQLAGQLDADTARNMTVAALIETATRIAAAVSA